MIGLLSKYLLPAVAAAAVAGFALAGLQTYRLANLRTAVAEASAQAQARARAQEAAWAVKVNQIQEVQRVEVQSIAAERDAAIASLRNRPARRMPATATASSDGAGATGAQLSRPDAEFLAGLAYRADATAAALRSCQAYIKEVSP